MVPPFRRDQPGHKNNVFVVRHPAFLAGMQRGIELFQQEHGHNTSLKDLALLEFYQDYLTPFEFDPQGNTGLMIGWMNSFLASGCLPGISPRNADFLIGYRDGVLDWYAMKKEELLTDVQFAEFMATLVDPSKLATIRKQKPSYTEIHQIGYAFGLVYALLSFSHIQIEESNQ